MWAKTPAVSASKMRIRTGKLFRIRLSCGTLEGPQSYRRKTKAVLIRFGRKDGGLILSRYADLFTRKAFALYQGKKRRALDSA